MKECPGLSETSGKLSLGKEEVRELLKKHNLRDVYKILSARILLPSKSIPQPFLWTIETKPRKIIISEGDLQKLRAQPSGPITLPSQEMARRWRERWQRRAGLGEM